jgi:hypothetical protein
MLKELAAFRHFFQAILRKISSAALVPRREAKISLLFQFKVADSKGIQATTRPEIAICLFPCKT